MKKSIIFAIILILLFVPLFSVTASAEYYNNNLDDMRSEAYYLVNTDTGTVVFSQNADERLKCASLVKIATAIVVVENCENLDAIVTVSESAVKPFEDTKTSVCDLQAGEEISVRNLLYCLMLDSANDAADVLAEYIAGNIGDFVKMMNDLAAELGCKNTNFTNAHGLDEDNEYSSAYDMYLITEKAYNNAVLADMALTVNYTVPATNLSEARELNTSMDIVESGSRYYYEYARGFKCGSTDGSQRCSAAVATKDAYTYIGIVLGCPNECIDGCGEPDNTALYEVRRMFKWAFYNMSMTTVAEVTDIITDIPVSLSIKADHVRLVPEKRIQALLLSTVDDSSLEYVCDVNKDVIAPVKKGDVLGTVKIKYADNVIAEVNLVAGDNVDRSALLYIGYVIKNVVVSPIFISIIALILVGIIVYIIVLRTKYKKRTSETRRKLKEGRTDNFSDSSDLSEIENDNKKIKK